MIKDMVNGYALGLVAMFLGTVMVFIIYLGANQLLQLTLGGGWPWLNDAWFQASLVIVSYIATVQVFNFITDKWLVCGWPLVATTFAALLSWLKFKLMWTDQTLTVFVVTTAISMASGLYRYRYHNRMAKITTT